TSSSDPICLLSLLDDSCQGQQKKVNPSITVVTHSTGLLPRAEHLLISFSPLFTTPSISFLFFPYSHLHLSYNLPYLQVLSSSSLLFVSISNLLSSLLLPSPLSVDKPPSPLPPPLLSLSLSLSVSFTVFPLLPLF